MTRYDNTWDKALQIDTAGRDEAHADQYHHPYEPTPYCVLERLAASGLISEKSTVLDYGCGKGRVSFYLAHSTGAKAIGIEYDQRIYQGALKNQQTAVSGARTAFICMRAEEYPVPAEVDCCYFFNPFSQEILHKVLARILESYYGHPREMYLCFYYPDDAYLTSLMAEDTSEYYQEIDCTDLFAGKDLRERIVVYRLPGYGK